jgi:pimeloyl-ACP methyl ester carboxylesterase
MDHTVPVFRQGVPGLIPDAWILGSACGPMAPAVVAVHGITRGVEEMVSHLLPRAIATGRTLVVPHFDVAHWPRYQQAACGNRADWALARLMAALRAEGRVSPEPFDLSGFSGGAQFAHRFAWLYPAMVARLCATAPGWWTFPDAEVTWPLGIGGASRNAGKGFHMRANLRWFLNRRIVVCVGSDDIERDENLRQGEVIDARQGPNRLTRARRWCAEAEACARAEGLTPAISLRVLQGCGHSFVECVTRGGLDHDFIQPLARCTGCRKTLSCGIGRAVHHLERTAA